jgi:6-methylsalicylate decarboxylase
MNNRRDFLRTAAAVGAAAMVPGAGLVAQAQRGQRAGRIDVHHHMIPRFQPGTNLREWSPQMSLDTMGKFGITTAILSEVQIPEYLNDGSEQARTMARRLNEYGAQQVKDHPGKFGFFASIMLADVAGSLREIEYAFDTLKADGAVINSSAAKGWPGAPAQMPIFEELNRRKASVLIHPNTQPFCCVNPPGMQPSMTEFDFDMNRAVLSLLLNGVMTKCPDVKFIIVHSGGTVPVLAGRVQDRVPKDRPDLFPTGALDKLRAQYYECAHASFPWAMAALRAFTTTDHILFGTDWPMEPAESTTDEIPGLKLPPDVLYAMERGNAERLFPRFKA